MRAMKDSTQRRKKIYSGLRFSKALAHHILRSQQCDQETCRVLHVAPLLDEMHCIGDGLTPTRGDEPIDQFAAKGVLRVHLPECMVDMLDELFIGRASVRVAERWVGLEQFYQEARRVIDLSFAQYHDRAFDGDLPKLARQFAGIRPTERALRIDLTR